MKLFQFKSASIVLSIVASGCSQLAMQAPHRSIDSRFSGGTGPDGVVRLGEDPDAFQTAVNPARRRANLLMTKARLSLADGEPDIAAQLLESILEEDPDHAEASHLLAMLRTRSGDLEAAENHFRTALRSEADNPRLNGDYGYFCYLVRRWDDAEQYLIRAIELDPGLTEAQTHLGMLEARRGEQDAAAERFRSAGCSEAEVLNNLALARLLEEDFAAAESIYRRALALDPEHHRIESGLRMASHMSSVAGGADRSSVPVAAGTAVVGE